MVAIGNRILKIDTMKVGKLEGFSAEEPLNCSVGKLIEGVQFVGKHDGEITELSMCQWLTTRLASASVDGMVRTRLFSLFTGFMSSILCLIVLASSKNRMIVIS